MILKILFTDHICDSLFLFSIDVSLYMFAQILNCWIDLFVAIRLKISMFSLVGALLYAGGKFTGKDEDKIQGKGPM